MLELEILLGGLDRSDVATLLSEHLDEMRSLSPPESAHALDLAGLRENGVTFWTAISGNMAVGCAALKELNSKHAEIKSMRTSRSHRGQGVAKFLIHCILAEAKQRDYQQLSLETGSMDFFLPARKLYEHFGFEYCPPFADYVEDANSVFMTLKF